MASQVGKGRTSPADGSALLMRMPVQLARVESAATSHSAAPTVHPTTDVHASSSFSNTVTKSART